MSILSCGIDNAACLRVDQHLFIIHLVLSEVFHLDGIEVAQRTVNGDEGEVDALYLHTLHHLTTEV